MGYVYRRGSKLWIGYVDASGAPQRKATRLIVGQEAKARALAKKQAAEARQKVSVKRKPLEDKLAKLDKDLATLNREKTDIETWLAREDAYAEENKTQLLAFLKRQGELTEAIAAVEWDWFEVQQKLEEAAA